MGELFVATPALHLLALLGVGLAAGFVNVVAGGGSLLTVPLLIFLGLPETTANGTSRIAIVTQSISAVTAFRRAGRLDTALLLRLAIPAVLGSIVGAYYAARLADASFRAILGWVMLGCALLVAAGPRFAFGASSGEGAAQLRVSSLLWVWPTLFAVGLYAGAVQAGVGYLILAALGLLLRLDLVQANVMKVVLVGVCAPPALAMFVWHGRVDLLLGLVLSAGQALGGWLGAAATLQRGERFIRLILVLVVVVSGVKLLLE